MTLSRHAGGADCGGLAIVRGAMDLDPIERLRLLARETPAVKLLVVVVVAVVLGLSMGLGAALFGLASMEALAFGVLGGLGAVPAVLLFLR